MCSAANSPSCFFRVYIFIINPGFFTVLLYALSCIHSSYDTKHAIFFILKNSARVCMKIVLLKNTTLKKFGKVTYFQLWVI